MKTLLCCLAGLLLLGTAAVGKEKELVRLRAGLVSEWSMHQLKANKPFCLANGSVYRGGGGLLLDYFVIPEYGYALTTGLYLNNAGGKLQYLPVQAPNGLITFKGNSYIDPFTVSYKLQYLELPLGLKFETERFAWATNSEGNSRKPCWEAYGTVGVQANFRLKATGAVEADGWGVNRNETEFKDQVALLAAGYNFGLGFNYYPGQVIGFTMGFFYKSNSFIDITRDGAQAQDVVDMGSFGLKLGLLF